MKKILLATAAAAIISTSSAYAMEDTFYLKAEGGLSKLAKIKGAKSKNTGSFGLGAGYYVMDNARVDLTFSHLANPTYKKTDMKYKAAANVLMFNGFYDLFENNGFKMFAGAGVGMSRVGAKSSGKTKASGTKVVDSKAKDKYSVAFAGYIGGSYEVSPGVDLETAYSYKALGTTKKFNDHTGVKIKGHNFGAGVRFSI